MEKKHISKIQTIPVNQPGFEPMPLQYESDDLTIGRKDNSLVRSCSSFTRKCFICGMFFFHMILH